MNELSKPAWASGEATDVLLAFSNGVVSRQRAMDALGIGYGVLLDRLCERCLPLPRLPEAEVERMVAGMVNAAGSCAALRPCFAGQGLSHRA